jgi:hypothetical protein
MTQGPLGQFSSRIGFSDFGNNLFLQPLVGTWRIQPILFSGSRLRGDATGINTRIFRKTPIAADHGNDYTA